MIHQRFNYSYFFLVAIIILMIIVRLFYISDPFLDFHSFRQTQTAITAYYLAQNDLSLSSLLFYETPVLGYPWQIPMEFPLYQYIGALIFKVLNIFADTKLDLVLRLESILLFFGTSFFLFKLTRITTSREVAIWTLILYLISPFSIEWSRDAMISNPLAIIQQQHCANIWHSTITIS